MISVATDLWKVNHRLQHRLNKRIDSIVNRWGGEEKKKKERNRKSEAANGGKSTRCKSRGDAVWYRVEEREEGEGARPASKRSIVQRTGKCSAGCSAHVQSLRPIHLCVHPCIYSRSLYSTAALLRYFLSYAKSLTSSINWRSVFFCFSYEEEIDRERNLNNMEEKGIFDEKFTRGTISRIILSRFVCREEKRRHIMDERV